jgi:addiction module RelB/DinJ family antitoxin
MTEQVRYRIKANLAREAAAVCERIGISPSAAVSLFFAQMVKAGGLPFRPSEFPALADYGVTLAEATAAEDKALSEIRRDRKAGKSVKFTGEL